ncbi:DUF1559 family PulG-like putative transporter [Aeoliella sp. SH292]|uniref:DUF1559 family PulG-like putative transporter n=1 Tax=Aeoliella sp. SH292 TaxID=3454464 RepID=UPI003F9E1C80
MTENPYESTDQPHGPLPVSGPLALLGKVALVLVILGGLSLLVIPARRGAREAARHNSCLNNVKQILLALHNYQEVHGELPPAYSVDAKGNQLHSWRALILPFIEGNTVHKLIDYSKPWDAPENEAARNIPSPFPICPSSWQEDEQLTTYLAVVGPEFLFDGRTPRKLSDVKDGLSNTLAIVEVSPDKAVHWMSPEDVDENFVFENTDENLRTGHPEVFIAGFLDGRVEGIQMDVDPEDLRAMLTIAGREVIE